MERKTHEPMLIDGMAADLGDPQTINPLEQGGSYQWCRRLRHQVLSG